MRDVNRSLLAVVRRAERVDSSQLVSTFVDVGALLTSLRSRDHQIVYGRRGTGKTHVLSVLGSAATDAGDLAVSIDLRTVGSNGGIYADSSLPIAERASRLLIDALNAIHDGVLAIVLDDTTFDLDEIQPALDALRESISEVRVVGGVETTVLLEDSDTTAHATSFGMHLTPKGANVGVKASKDASSENKSQLELKRHGDERHRVHFGTVNKCLENLVGKVKRSVWILIDEWSEIPLPLQPFLADLLRRTIFPTRGFVVKIAAIEQRTQFRTQVADGEYVGFEIGADAAASLSLDEFMVFDSNSAAAVSFFRELLAKHIAAVAEPGTALAELTADGLVTAAFTQITALEELVRAAEGVPRDAINIAGEAAKLSNDNAISVANVRRAAQNWYQQSKEQAVGQRSGTLEFLHWVIEQVIKGRKARAFLVPTHVRSELLDFLYDSRVLHVIKKGVSSNDTPGIRYLVYAIDYGCYVDLISTTFEPMGLFEVASDEKEEFVQVPATDYRSIRRAILDIEGFQRHESRGSQTT